jgi:geranylgeranyl diphosphate synthase type II
VRTVTGVDFPTYLATRGRLIDDAVESALPPAEHPPQIIHQAMRYSVLGGGKRLRPLLVVATAETCGGDPRTVLPVACAVEFIHTYSLIHDDLPAMDNSDTRRGRPTCHIAYGEAIAVLAGDALHALAFDLIARASPACDAERVLAVSRDIATAIGTAGMVGGQVLDLLGEGRTFPGSAPQPIAPLAEFVPEIHRRKTAALIAACVRAGALLAGADSETLRAFSVYGERLGLAFQIIDDILDVIGDDHVLGKRAGSDVAKATYPAAFGVARSREIAAHLTAQAVEALEPLGDRVAILQELARSLLARER